MNPVSATIVALATPPGRSALGIIRLSGKDTKKIIAHLTRKNLTTINNLVPRRLYYFNIYDHNKQPLDKVLLVIFSASHSYTGEDSAEIYFHGNPVIARQILNTAVTFGASTAYGGEFTYRAVLNGKLDLNQAEAVYNLIHTPTKDLIPKILKTLSGKFSNDISRIAEQFREMYAEVEARINYPEEELKTIPVTSWKKILDRIYRQISDLIARAELGRIQMTTPSLLIVGKQNVGKSSLFNCLLAEEAALVSPEPGTTRDVITKLWEWQDFTFNIGDTAGMFARKSTTLDKQAIELTRKKIDTASGLIFVLDRSQPIYPEEIKFLRENTQPAILVINKIDLPAKWGINDLKRKLKSLKKYPVVFTSAINQQGIEKLRKTIYHHFTRTINSSEVLLIGETIFQKLKKIPEKISELQEKLATSNLDLLSFLFAELLEELEIVAGKTTSEDILNQIFTRFCVGK